MNERSLNKNRILCLILSLLMVVSVGIVDFSNARSARADVVAYSNVLDDLKKDENFKEETFPINNDIKKAGNFPLEVITLAEGSDGDLFVYVYDKNSNFDKNGKHIATSIMLSLSEAKDVDPSPYFLTFLSKEKQFFKYKIRGINYNKIEAFKNSDTRYYFIVSILRAYDEAVDAEAPTGQTISEVSFGVGQEHTFKTENGVTTHTFQLKEVLKITDKYVGFLRWTDGVPAGVNGLDSHFVAFSSNFTIDKLLEAKLRFDYQKYTFSSRSSTYEYSEAEVKGCDVILTPEQQGGGDIGWWFTKTELGYPRIQKFEDFIKCFDSKHVLWQGVFTQKCEYMELKDDALLALNSDGDYKYKWVLRYFDTDYNIVESNGFIVEFGTFVKNVVILRLSFLSDDKFYNLGIVDNVQTGSIKPTGEGGVKSEVNDDIKDFFEKFWFLCKLLFGVILVVVIIYLIRPILPIIGKVFAAILTAPIKLVVSIKQALVKKKSCKEQESKDKSEKNEKKRR